MATSSTPSKLSGPALVASLATASEQDIYYYGGSITYFRTCALIDTIGLKSPKRKNALLLLATAGGDPDAAYRVMRALRRSYKEVTIGVVGWCKSAGTLMAAGAHQVIVAPTAEFGPLDIQVRKPDEVYASGSGLDIFQAVAATSASAFDTFEKWLMKLAEDTGGGLSTKTAAELASQMAVGLFQPLMGQIDPHRIGEMQRTIKIVQTYAERLGTSTLKAGALNKLTRDYPSHGFVIDVEEATANIFRNIRPMSAEELELAALCPNSRHFGPESAIVFDLEARFSPPPGVNNGVASKRSGSGTALPKRAGRGNGTGRASAPVEPRAASDGRAGKVPGRSRVQRGLNGSAR